MYKSALIYISNSILLLLIYNTHREFTYENTIYITIIEWVKYYMV